MAGAPKSGHASTSNTEEPSFLRTDKRVDDPVRFTGCTCLLHASRFPSHRWCSASPRHPASPLTTCTQVSPAPQAFLKARRMESLVVNAGLAVACAGQPRRADPSAAAHAPAALPAGEMPSGSRATASGAHCVRGRLPRRSTRPSLVSHLLLDHCLEEEQGTEDEEADAATSDEEADDDDAMALDQAGMRTGQEPPSERRTAPAVVPSPPSSGGGPAFGGPGRSGDGAAPRGGLEPVFKFQPLPSLAQLEDIVDDFHSTYMATIVRTWPQAEVTRTSRRANADGAHCPGARSRAARGTDADVKTWSSRIHTAVLFADFVGRVLCIPRTGPRPSDAEIDRGVKKFFACLNPLTLEVINLFLDARRRGYAVAGGGKPVQEKTIKAYSAGLSHLFARARVSGTTGPRVVPDCLGVSSPWQLKGLPELEKEKAEVREDAGKFMGNPMMTDDVRSHKSSAEKDARQSGEHSTTSADVTPAMLLQLYNSMVLCHMPAAKNAESSSQDDAAPAADDHPPVEAHALPLHCRPPAAPLGTSAASRTAVETDFLAYLFYAFLFVTLARPVSLLNLKYKGITLPDPLVASNEQFFNKCVWKRCLVAYVLCWSGLCLLAFWSRPSRHHVEIMKISRRTMLTTAAPTACQSSSLCFGWMHRSAQAQAPAVHRRYSPHHQGRLQNYRPSHCAYLQLLCLHFRGGRGDDGPLNVHPVQRGPRQPAAAAYGRSALGVVVSGGGGQWQRVAQLARLPKHVHGRQTGQGRLPASSDVVRD